LVKATCPACNNITELVPPLDLGQHLTCPVCKTCLEIIWLYPICLDYAEFEESNNDGNFTGVLGVAIKTDQ